MEGSIELTKASDGKLLILGNIGSGYGTTGTVFHTDKNIYIGKIAIDGSLDRDFGAPVNSLGNTVLFKEGESAISLASSATLIDKDLRDTNYNGVVVTLSRQGGANANDIFGTTGNLTFTDGSVKLSNTTIGTVTNTDGNLTITFNSDANQTAVNQTLSSITYANNATSLPSSVVIAWSVNDNNSGSQGSGGALSGSGITTVTIQKTPKISGASGTVTEDGSITLTLSNFGTYSSLGSETGFNYIKIISLPTNGTLTNDGSEVSEGDYITASDIDSGYLTFTPNANIYGDSAGNFSFQVGVNSEETNYEDVWSQTYTMELNVSGVNDAPSFKVSEGLDSIVLNNHYLDSYSDNVMALQNDGKMVVVGRSDGGYFQVVRVNSDGTSDSSFGDSGKVILNNYNGYLKAIKIDANGNIFVTGRGNSKVVVAQLNSSGVQQFATEVNFSLDYDYVRDLALDSAGKIVVVGSTYDDDNEENFAIARLNSDGTLDSSFDTDGIVEINNYQGNYDWANAVVIQGEKILVGGTNDDGQSALYRLNSDGSIDNTFNYSSGLGAIYYLKYDESIGIIAGKRSSIVEVINATDGTQISLTPLGTGNYVKDMVTYNGTTYYSIYNSSDDKSTVLATGTNGFTKKFATGEQGESYSASIEIANDGSLLVGSVAYDADWNDIYTITKLNSTNGEIITIGGESSLGQSISHDRAAPIVLDSDVTIKDSELDGTNYNGATITLAREGGASSEDHFSFTDTISVSGNTLSLGNTLVGTFSLVDGNMTITFGDVNTSVVNTTLRNITYQNSGTGEASVTIDWTFNDGNGATNTSQGTGGAKITAGTTQVAMTGTYVAPTTNNVKLSVPYKGGTTEVTIISPSGTNITGATNNASNTNPQKGTTLPLGSFAFDVNGLTTGQTVTMSMIVDKSIGSYAYYKKNLLTNKWVNITKSVTFLSGANAGKVKIDFDLTDGGAFDSDRSANGTIKDPGGIATNKLTPYVLEGTTLVGDASFVEDSTAFSGTIAYSISGGADAEKFNINSTTGELTFKTAPSYTHPTDIGDIAENNTYVVEVTVTGSTSGQESRAITVSVLSATGTNTPKAIAPAISSDNITISQGTASGSTKVAYTPATGNTIKYIFSTDAIAIPAYDATLPNGATTYTSGSDISGAVADKYLTIYEVDSAGNIVGYYQQQITAQEIKDGTTTNPTTITMSAPILDQVIDINAVSHFTLDLRNFISNATAYSFTRVQSTDSIGWLTLNSQTGEFSASGTVATGTYYIKVTATNGSASKIVYFTLRAKDLTTNLATNITKPTGATNTTGTSSGKTYAETTLNNSDAKVFDDGSASHSITGVASATSQLPDSTVVMDEAGDVTTSTTTINDAGDVVDIVVEGKVSGEAKAIHTLKIGTKETKATSKIVGTTTTIKSDRTVETTATVGGSEATATALSDGTATHILKVGMVESKATIEIAGAETVIDTTGITTSVDENQTIGGNVISVKSVVKTDTQGESQTWFEDSNGQQLERTVSTTTPLESGAEIKVGNDTNGKVQFIIETKVTRDLVIE